MRKIVHIITGLSVGGAENMLYKLLKYSDRDKYYHEVISLMDEGIYGEKIEKLGIKVHYLRVDKENIIRSLIKARSICKEFDIVDTWLYHADIFGFIIAKILLRKKLIWNIRHSNLDNDANKSSTLKIVKINSILSKFVDSITYNSNKAQETHLEVGYKDINSIIIPNGFELNKFKYSFNDRLKTRKALGLLEEDKVIITVGRWNIQKDYYTLLKALKKLKLMNSEFKMLMVGSNLDNSNNELLELIKAYNLIDNIILLGRRNDVPQLLSAADVYISSSLGESFSNSIGEAMACELQCVVTDVGDSKIMIGETGKVVESKNYNKLCDELYHFINEDIIERNSEARERVIGYFDIKSITTMFESNIDNLYVIY